MSRKPADLADREAEWAAGLLASDWDALARVAREPLPVDAPDEARARWAARRNLLAVAGVTAAIC